MSLPHALSLTRYPSSYSCAAGVTWLHKMKPSFACPRHLLPAYLPTSRSTIEAISFGVNYGVEINTIKQAIGCEGRYRMDFHRTAQRIAGGQGNNVCVKFRELPYFLKAAQQAGFELSITQVVRDFCDKGERIVIDDHRQAPSYWHELTHR